jgi:Na+-translocating ferredoxin:NAD+ oxidoreductase RnfC subunit
MTKKKSESELIEIARQKGIKGMTEEQMKAVKETERHLSSALQMIFECQDMYMSDIRNLEQSMWDLRRAFDLDRRDW